MKAKNWIAIGITVLLIVALSFVALHGLQFGKYIFQPVGEALSLGLDLRGGIYTEYIATDTTADDFDALMEGTVSVLRTRLTDQGYTEATITRQGTNKIRVEIPDISDPQQVLDIIGTPAHLEFRDPSGNVVIEGKDIKNAFISMNEGQTAYTVAFELNAEGKQKFADATANLVGKAISIYMDDSLISSPTVNEAITGGNGAISFGNMSYEESYTEAKKLSSLIMSGALPLDITEGETRAISATLGVNAIDSAIMAGIIGISLVFLFMIIMYRLPGLMADLALCLYILIVFYALAISQAQLTLPGIAGILLGVGMAVDANVIIFERFREEVRSGRSMDSSVKIGFKNALSAIIDSNVTTIIAALVLLYFGTGSIKGFAVTLLIGVITSLISAVFITRFLLKRAVALNIKNQKLYIR